MEIHSKIYLREVVKNTERKFGAQLEYIPAYIEFPDGSQLPALFTKHQIQEAMDRGAANQEDCEFEEPGFLARVFG